MARGRRDAKREAAEQRAAEAASAVADAQAAAQARAAKDQQILRRWGTPRGALHRLGAVSKELEQLHRAEMKLLTNATISSYSFGTTGRVGMPSARARGLVGKLS